uniref:HLH1 protein n=1 Tax=Caragana korshinskii TaxID=220689 RepID=A0A1W5HTB1_9FABA|nr:HLH1 protein [Caragana korshinskii]
MEVPWQNVFSDLEMVDGGVFFNHDHRHENSFDDEELILREFAFSSEDRTNILNDRSESGEVVVTKNTNVVAATHDESCGPKHPNCEQAGGGSGEARPNKRKPSDFIPTNYHNMAERKRRLELSQRLIALSAIIPGLNKIDKGSILKEAVSYVKQLQIRVNELEEEQRANDLHMDKDIAPNYKMNPDDCHKLNVALPEVKARVMEKEVFIRIHCEKNYGVLLKTLSHIKSLHLSIVSHSVLPFGKFSLVVTINAQVLSQQ